MLEVLREDYIRTAHAKGLLHRVIVNRHALKSAMLPVVTVIGIEFAFLIGSLVVTEQGVQSERDRPPKRATARPRVSAADRRPSLAIGRPAGKQVILAANGNRPVILPMSGRRSDRTDQSSPDSPLERNGFELPVPVRQAKLTRSCR
jgi:hypothetical protein